MEKLVLCSNILYNEDLLDKKKEIEYLKNIITKKPKIIFKNKSSWIERKNKLLNNLEKKIYKIIVEEDYLYDNTENIKYYDNNICNGQRYNIYYILYKELNKLTYSKYKDWCENISYEILFSLDSAIQTLKLIDKLDDLSNEELCNVITKNILWQLDDGQKIDNIIYHQ